MSRLVMLPNARCVPEFPPVSSGRNLGTCWGEYRECQNRRTLRSKSPEADYLAAVRGIIAGPLLVVAKRDTGNGSGRRPGGGPGRLVRLQGCAGPPEGRDLHEFGAELPLRSPTYAPDWAELEEIGPGRQGCTGRGGNRAKYLRWEARMTFPNPPSLRRCVSLESRSVTTFSGGSCGDSQKKCAPGCRLVTAGDGNMVRVDYMGHPRQALY